MNYIPGIGYSSADLMIISDCPNYKDALVGKPFQDRETLRILSESGIDLGSTWLTNVFKYEVPPNSKGKRIPAYIRAKNAGIDVEQSINELQNEINGINPKVILALGNTALWACTGKNGIGNFRGSILWGMGRKVIPTYRPSDLSFQSPDPECLGYYNRFVIDFDCKRAVKQSKFKDLQLPHRTLQVCRNSYELSQFYERYKHLSSVSVDIEAGGSCLPICIGLAFNKSHGMCVPLWNHDGISTIPDSDLVQLWILLDYILTHHDTIGQNFNYDRDKLKRIGFTVRKVISDTLLKAQAINPELPKRLAFNTSLYTEEPFYKDEGMYEGKIEDLFLGCARDACVTYEVDENMEIDLVELNQKDYYENFLMQLPEFYAEMEQTGFGIDVVARERLFRKYIKWDEELKYELWQLTGEHINPASPKQVAILLFDVLKCPRRDGTGEEELTSLLNLQSFTDETKRKIVENILTSRRVRRTINGYLMALPDFDGRMRTTFFIALETGRSSTSQQDPPIRPVMNIKTGEFTSNRKKGQNYKALGMAFQTMTKHGDIGADVREMFIP